MNVVFKKGSKKLISGVIYEVKNLWNNGQNQKWLEGKIELKEISGIFSVNNFRDTNGGFIPSVNYITSNSVTPNIRFEDIKKGDILVCKVDGYKTMLKNGMYRVEYLDTFEYNIGNYKRKERYIKFEGVKRRFKFNPWRFRKLTADESREIQLGALLEGKDPNIIKSTDISKIEFSHNKEKVLMEILSKAILDENRHYFSILDWACKKSGENMKLKSEDYQTLLTMSLKDILDKIESN
jgi:hypothetical protein